MLFRVWGFVDTRFRVLPSDFLRDVPIPRPGAL